MATKTKTKAVQDFLELLKNPDVREALDLQPRHDEAFKPGLSILSADGITVDQIEAPDGVWVEARVLYQSRTYGQAFASNRIDGAGNKFVSSRFMWGNYSYAYIRKYSPAGVVLGKWQVCFPGLPRVPNPGVTGVGKVDGVSITPTGTDIEVQLTDHVLDAMRQNQNAVALIEDVWVPYTGGALGASEEGATPTFIPTGSDPDPEVEVTIEQIEAVVKFQVERIVGADQANSLVNRFSHGDDVRGQIRKVGKQALVYLADPANYNDPNDPEHLAQKYQDAQFGMTLNAIWVDLVKMVTGSEEATGYDAARLNAALRALIRNPQESEEPTS